MDFQTRRTLMVASLTHEIADRRVLAAMAHVPREVFVPAALQQCAYEDRPLPIAYNQTISQPFMVALMTQALMLTGTEKILELGTGSGYQTAILAELARQVVTVERLPGLAETAKKTLQIIGYQNIEFHLAEKSLGWRDSAPYDAIITTAGAPNIPEELVNQLAIGGRLVIPVGSRYSQELMRVTKQKSGNKVEEMGGCRFVALIGDEAWEEDNPGRD